MTLAQAKRIIQLELSGRGLAFTKLTAKTVSFSDLARGSVIFVTVHGWTPNTQWGDIQRVAFDNGFRVEAEGGIFLGVVRSRRLWKTAKLNHETQQHEGGGRCPRHGGKAVQS